MNAGVWILTYHSLDDSGSVISIAPDAFARQMESLAARGFTGISLRRLLDGWDGTTALPERPIVLTFDDGFANVADHGVPILRRLGFSGTVFVVSDYCGRSNDWPTQPAGVPRLPLMSWGVLGDLASAGMEVGAHTRTHPWLTELAAGEARREIVESKRRIEDALGAGVETFAYPYGAGGGAERAVAAGEFRAACCVELGPARPTDDRCWLNRLDVYYLRDPRVFDVFDSTIGRAYVRVRGWGKRCRGVLERPRRRSAFSRCGLSLSQGA